MEASDHSPLVAEGSLRRGSGYAATPLTGVWANYPFLHNGNVPTLYHLLGPVSERPRIFEVMGAARTLDRDRIGQRLHADPSSAGLDEEELIEGYRDDRDGYFVGRPGSSNAGHDV